MPQKYDPRLVGNRTYTALKALYDNCHDMQLDPTIASFRCRDQQSFMKEFCTVRMTTARRSGHTTAIAKLVNEYPKDWVILLHNLQMAKRVHDLIWANNTGKISKATIDTITYDNDKTVRFMSIGSFETRLPGLEIEGIIVDCAFFLNQEKTDKLYNIGGAAMRLSRDQYFIFVG